MRTTIHTKTFYDPVENRLITNRKQGHGDNWEDIGCKKIAEAMTSVFEKERPLIWAARKGGWIDLDKLNSKLKHKMRKLKIDKYYAKSYRDYSLLEKINKKYNLK